MKKIKSILLAFIIILMPLIGSGCGAGGDQLIVWWPSGKDTEGVIQEAIQKFTAETGVSVKIETKAGMDIFDAYKYALNDEKTRPDLAIIDHVYIQALAHDGLLAELNALGASELTDVYPGGLLDANRYGTGLYGLPMSANTVILMYNRDILEASGVTEVPETFEELLAACEAVKNNTDATPFAQPVNDFAAMQFVSYVARSGGKLVSDDYKTSLIDTPEVESALEKWKIFSDKGYINTMTYEEDKFYNGKVAFIEMGSWSLSKVSGASARFDCGFAPMVKIKPDEGNYAGLGLYSLVVAGASKKKENAYKLAEILSTDKKCQLDFNTAKNLLAVTKEALENSYYTDDDALSVYAVQLQNTVARPGTPVWPDLEMALVNMLRSTVINRDVTAALAAANSAAQSAADRLFK